MIYEVMFTSTLSEKSIFKTPLYKQKHRLPSDKKTTADSPLDFYHSFACVSHIAKHYCCSRELACTVSQYQYHKPSLKITSFQTR